MLRCARQQARWALQLIARSRALRALPRAERDAATALATAVSLYLVLVPGLDDVGAALAFGGGVAVYRISSTIQIARRHGVRSAGSLSLVATATVLVCVGGPLLVARILGGDHLAGAIVGGVIGLVCFEAVLGRLRRRKFVDLTLR